MHIISFMQKQVNRALPDYVKMMVSYTNKKLSSCFNVKDKTVFNHEYLYIMLNVQRNLDRMIM